MFEQNRLRLFGYGNGKLQIQEHIQISSLKVRTKADRCIV